jgi:hypothetical protein
MANREVVLGNSLPRAARLQPNAGALTQALGTKDADYIHPTVQRFILEEDGVLLLCSDGLSDHGWVETLWEDSTQRVLKDKMSLDAAMRSWLELANQRNGHDNASVVLLDCRASLSSPQLFEPGDVPLQPSDTDLSDTARALLYPEDEDEPDLPWDSGLDEEAGDPPEHHSNTWGVILGLALLCFLVGGVGILVWRYVNTYGVRDGLEQLLIPEQPDEANPEEMNESEPQP